MISYGDLDCFAGLMRGHGWRFARTMSDAPHWYTLRKNWHDEGMFEWAVSTIRAEGYSEKFGGRAFVRLNANGFKYWTMGAPLDDTILINRATVECKTEFDCYADRYDEMFTDQDSVAENTEVMDMLGDVSGRRVLDVGSGTGLLLDYRADAILVENYVGVDPSKAMFREFARKHPDYAGRVVVSKFEDFAFGRFDLIVGIFGSPSYITPGYLTRVREMLQRNGRYFLMFFRPGYIPVSSIKGGVQPHFFERSHEVINGGAGRFHEYMICEGGQ